MRRVQLVVVALALAGCGADEKSAITVPGERGFLYDVGGELIYLECAGSGGPTVVLEAGLAGDHRDWNEVMPDLEARGRVCSYDRSGIGYSQVGTRRATAAEKVRDLHDLLGTADEDPPYVLVGHSFGGMLVRLYASTYRDEVAGVILVDSGHPDQDPRLDSALIAAHGRTDHLRQVLAQSRREHDHNLEGVKWRATAAQVRATPSLGELPLIVITAGLSEVPDDLRAVLTLLGERRYKPVADRVWFSLQRELARLSAQSVHVVATDSGHIVMSNLGQPQIVVASIREVVSAVRAGRQLRSCEEIFDWGDRRCL